MLDSPNFLAAVNQLCDEKKIPKEKVIEAIKEAMAAAYRKDYGNKNQNIDVILDEATGRASIIMIKTVVTEIENRDAELSMEEARQIKKDIKEGAKLKIDVTPIDFGRIASQAAKQVIIQKLQEAERDAVYEEYNDREDELLNALVHHMEGRFAYLELDRTTAVLEPRDQIPRESYSQGQRLKVYLERVEMTGKGPKLRVSRTHPRFIFRLMELEIPEVRNGIVIVKAIARDPGVRCKLVVDSTDESVDPVGACVGQKGARIQNITDEVNGERIDVIQHTDDFDALLKEALSPARLDFVRKYEDEKRVEVFVAEDQRALAIGKSGQNVRLAAEIMGWEIDVMNTAEIEGDAQPEKAKPADANEDEAAPAEEKTEDAPKEEVKEEAGDTPKEETKEEVAEEKTEEKVEEVPAKEEEKAEEPAEEKTEEKVEEEPAEETVEEKEEKKED